jgi:3-oxoacyl-[acyl-carrier-protein] synthase-3
MANAFVKAGMAKQILLVNADTYSKYINRKDRSTRVLFGDGAATTIVKESNERKGIIDIVLRSAGSGFNKFWMPAGGLRLPKSENTSLEVEDDKGNIRTQNDIKMDGFGVWAFINSVVPKELNRLLKRNNLEQTNIDHTPNPSILISFWVRMLPLSSSISIDVELDLGDLNPPDGIQNLL